MNLPSKKYESPINSGGEYVPGKISKIQYAAAKESGEPLSGGGADTCKIIVVGSGPVGMRFVSDYLALNPRAHVHLYGNEPYTPYNRVQLSALLTGDVDREAIDIPLPDSARYPNFRFFISAIQSIDPENQCVVDANDVTHCYQQLVLAIGARAHVPSIPGVEMKGVYTFRNMKDATHLSARVASSRHAVVVGGGLLGLEAAKGLLKLNTRVTLVQQGPTLMNRQLHSEAAACLREIVESMGIEVITQSGAREIVAEQAVEGIRLRCGRVIACDTVLLCAGITPNVELARAARLKVAKGIVVDECLQTSDPHIFALGECCEYEGTTYGLVAPGFEQAAVVAQRMNGQGSVYKGSLAATRLKVVGESVSSMGQVNELPNRPKQWEICWRDKKQGSYRKIVVHKGRLIGACALGDWPEQPRIVELFKAGRSISIHQMWLFKLTGRLWVSKAAEDVRNWPATAVVCQCNGVSKKVLADAVKAGSDDLHTLQLCTGAGTVCGSCKPLLSELLDGDAPSIKEVAWKWLLVTSVFSVMLALAIVVVPEAQRASSVLHIGFFESIWSDKFYKQVTGFTLLGLSIVALVISLRKRLNLRWLGNFSHLRIFHSVLGVACAGLLVWHTGFHLGSNLNQALMVNFLLVLVLGACAGIAVSLSHKLRPVKVQSVRRFWAWLHILVTWPLPVLLTLHILSVYYF